MVQLGFVRDHEDWLILVEADDEGATYVYDLANTELRAYLGEQIRRYLEEFDADGILLDMVGIIGPEGGPFRGEPRTGGPAPGAQGLAQTMERCRSGSQQARRATSGSTELRALRRPGPNGLPDLLISYAPGRRPDHAPAPSGGMLSPAAAPGEPFLQLHSPEHERAQHRGEPKILSGKGSRAEHILQYGRVQDAKLEDQGKDDRADQRPVRGQSNPEQRIALGSDSQYVGHLGEYECREHQSLPMGLG
jgi:hypothetical protein